MLVLASSGWLPLGYSEGSAVHHFDKLQVLELRTNIYTYKKQCTSHAMSDVYLLLTAALHVLVLLATREAFQSATCKSDS